MLQLGQSIPKSAFNFSFGYSLIALKTCTMTYFRRRRVWMADYTHSSFPPLSKQLLVLVLWSEVFHRITNWNIIEYLSYLYRVSQKKVGSQKNSNCFNSLNFEAKIDCNIIKPNVAKWRKTCTGLKFDLLNFYGPQSNIHTFWDPSFFWLTLY